MKLVRWMAIVFAFTLEIRVKAAQQEPTHCLSQKNVPCSLFAFEPSMVKTKQFELTLATGAILFREKDSGEWNFVGGTLRVTNRVVLRLHTKLGTLLLAPGIKWLQWREEKLWIYSIEGATEVKLLSSRMPLNLVPENFFNWFGLVDRNGQNEQGVPKRLTPSVAGTFLPGFRRHSDFKLVEKAESRGIAMASEFYRDIAQRMEDSYHQRQRSAELRELERLQLEKRVRELFRQKYFGPVDLPEEDDNTHN